MSLGDLPLLLIIDDDPDQLALARVAALRAGGMRVITAESGAEALIQLQAREALGRRPPDLVLTDLKMPNMDGIDLLHGLQARDDMRGVPIIFLTTSAYPRDRLKAEAKGAAGFFQKPMRFDELVAIMRSLPDFLPHPEPEWLATPWQR
jgi:two-component system KDP operon response regulator KdpE